MTAETNTMINEEISNQMTRKLNEKKRKSKSPNTGRNFKCYNKQGIAFHPKHIIQARESELQRIGP